MNARKVGMLVIKIVILNPEGIKKSKVKSEKLEFQTFNFWFSILRFD